MHGFGMTLENFPITLQSREAFPRTYSAAARIGWQRELASRARPRSKVAAMKPPRVCDQEGADLNEVLLDLKRHCSVGHTCLMVSPLPGWAGIEDWLQIPSMAFLINYTYKCKGNGSCFSTQGMSPRTRRYKNKVALQRVSHYKHSDRPTAGPNQETLIRECIKHRTLTKVPWCCERS